MTARFARPAIVASVLCCLAACGTELPTSSTPGNPTRIPAGGASVDSSTADDSPDTTTPPDPPTSTGALGDPCTFDSDCDSGCCADGSCAEQPGTVEVVTSGCASSSDCDDGYDCSAGDCVPADNSTPPSDSPPDGDDCSNCD
jgi:hypothetical protein